MQASEVWLIAERNVLTGEVKCFLSNAPTDTPVETLLHIAFTRLRIEHGVEDLKAQVSWSSLRQVRLVVEVQLDPNTPPR